MYKIIFIIFLFLFLFLLYQNKYYLNLYFSSPNNYNHYRLSDMITANENIRNNPMGKNYHLKNYPNTIVSKYLKATNITGDFDLLYKIISEYDKDIKPEKDLLIVHLRVGEVLNHSKYSLEEYLTKEIKFEKNTPKNFVKPLYYYKNILIEHRKELPKKVQFVAGGCFCDDKNKSYKYIEAVKEIFDSEGFEVLENTYFNHPDKDFVYMSRSSHFIKSGGGFSELITKIIEKRKGKIYN